MQIRSCLHTPEAPLGSTMRRAWELACSEILLERSWDWHRAHPWDVPARLCPCGIPVHLQHLGVVAGLPLGMLESVLESDIPELALLSDGCQVNQGQGKAVKTSGMENKGAFPHRNKENSNRCWATSTSFSAGGCSC